MRKIIFKWLLGTDMTTYSEVVNKYGKSLDEHEDTLKMLETLIDRYEETIQYMNMMREKISDLESQI